MRDQQVVIAKPTKHRTRCRSVALLIPRYPDCLVDLEPGCKENRGSASQEVFQLVASDMMTCQDAFETC